MHAAIDQETGRALQFVILHGIGADGEQPVHPRLCRNTGIITGARQASGGGEFRQLAGDGHGITLAVLRQRLDTCAFGFRDGHEGLDQLILTGIDAVDESPGLRRGLALHQQPGHQIDTVQRERPIFITHLTSRQPAAADHRQAGFMKGAAVRAGEAAELDQLHRRSGVAHQYAALRRGGEAGGPISRRGHRARGRFGRCCDQRGSGEAGNQEGKR